MRYDKSLMSGTTKMLVMSLIDSGDKYGYEIIRELEQKSYGAFKLKEGTLYPILKSLEKDDMVKSFSFKMENNRIRKYYKLTQKGRAFLFSKKNEWAEFSSKINIVIGN
jgi:PadR family transcriptional regulator PadR